MEVPPGEVFGQFSFADHWRKMSALARCLVFLCARSFFWVVVVGWSVCGLVLVSVLLAPVLRCLGCLGFFFFRGLFRISK